ncbi:MAG: PqqD family protein [Candidatus Omnitrophica bacterium]|nr:PqqD family protein [Candidatus Omnitrophota bacterium]
MKEFVPYKSDKVAYRIIDNEAVCVFLETQEVFVFNEVGSFIWELIDGKNDFREIVRKVVSEFEVGYSEAEEDIDSFLEELKQKNLIYIR